MKNILFVLLMFCASKACGQGIMAHYKIYDVKAGKEVGINEIVKSMDKYNVLFFGEEHNDSIGHYLEAEIFRQLFAAYPARAAVSMEMFHRDVQTVVDEYLTGIIAEKNFLKEGRSWNNYKDYRPVIEFAKANKLSVIAANAATRYSNVVTSKGLSSLNMLGKTSLRNVAPLPIDTATGRYYEKFLGTLGGHSMGPMKIFETQNLWDATMAWSVAQYLKENPQVKILHLNGRFHTDEQLGTFARFKNYAPRAKAMNISCFSAADFNAPDWNQYKQLGDYVILTDPGVKRSY